MIKAEIEKVYSDDSSGTEVKEFKNTKELYEYVTQDFLEPTLESARKEMTQNEFIILCLNICDFMLKYFT